MSETVPVIDLAPWFDGDDAARREVARRVDAALKGIGFFVIVNHGIPAEQVDAARAAGWGFFGLPEAEKRRIANRRAVGSPRGYIAMGGSTLALTTGERAPPDIREGYSMGTLDLPAGFTGDDGYYGENRWPVEPAGFRPAIEAYYRAMERLARDLFRVFAAALGLEPGYFLSRFDGHNSTLRINHYPAQHEVPLAGQLRAGAHTDYGAFTVLLPQNVSGGLQVRTRQGTWIDVLAPDGSFVINVGDLLMMWTNDVWLSNMHRVVNPAPEVARTTPRQSIAFFANPREDVLIECIPSCRVAGEPARHPPILAGDHRRGKIRAATPQPDTATSA